MDRSPDQIESLLSKQVAYYRAVAPEYEEGALEMPGGEELEAALEAFGPSGDVLELACGTGIWTTQLQRHAERILAVDASAEMLEIASSRVGDGVSFVEADIFDWRPDRCFDVVFFGFWLSHVPLERFEAFWELVADCLVPGGRVFFADDAYRTPDELIEGEASSVIRRRLRDGTSHRAIKVPHTPGGLEERLRRLGWQIDVHATSGPFFWGSGTAPR